MTSNTKSQARTLGQLNSPYAADLYGEIWLSEDAPSASTRKRLTAYLPGLIIVGVASAAAAWISQAYAMPVILAGLLIGLALSFISSDERTHAGLDLCGTRFLRWGIALLGTQVTAMQIGSLGIAGFAGLAAIMALVIGAGLLGAKLAGRSNYIGWLAGGATAICGASAAMAIYALIGKERLEQSQFTLTLVGVTLCSAVAMSFYPVIAAQLAFTDKQAGFLMGAAVHDVAQSLGAGFSFSQGAGEYTTVVKLTRVALLAPIVALIAFVIGNISATTSQNGFLAKIRMPWFILAFFALLALNSFVTLPAAVQEYGLIISKTLLLFAVTARAMRSRLETLLGQGWRALAPVILASITAFAAALGFAWGFL